MSRTFRIFLQRNRRTMSMLVITTAIMLTIGRYIVSSGRANSLPTASNLKKPESSIISVSLAPKLTAAHITNCFQVNFSQQEVDNICSPMEKQPSCLVNRIDHLNKKEFMPARLNMPPGSGKLAMLVHPPWDMISQSIMKQGSWELHIVNYMRAALLALPGAGLLDVGSQLGVFSLHAAQMGRKVVAIDAFYQNTMRLRASVSANRFEDRVRVYWNALAIDRGTMNMQIPKNCNIGGGSPIRKDHSPHWLDSIKVRNTGLDDIVLGGNSFYGVKELVIKIDIEGHEWLVMATGSGVFKRFNVTMVIMEWVGIKLVNPGKAPELINFFKSHNLQPYELSGANLNPLPAGDFMKWPMDILWLTKQFANVMKVKG